MAGARATLGIVRGGTGTDVSVSERSERWVERSETAPAARHAAGAALARDGKARSPIRN